MGVQSFTKQLRSGFRTLEPERRSGLARHRFGAARKKQAASTWKHTEDMPVMPSQQQRVEFTHISDTNKTL